MRNTTYNKISSYLLSIASFNLRTLPYLLLRGSGSSPSLKQQIEVRREQQQMKNNDNEVFNKGPPTKKTEVREEEKNTLQYLPGLQVLLAFLFLLVLLKRMAHS